jgi:hypothetical protein
VGLFLFRTPSAINFAQDKIIQKKSFSAPEKNLLKKQYKAIIDIFFVGERIINENTLSF